MACAFGSPTGSCAGWEDCACCPATGLIAWGWAFGTPLADEAVTVCVCVTDPHAASASTAPATSAVTATGNVCLPRWSNHLTS